MKGATSSRSRLPQSIYHPFRRGARYTEFDIEDSDEPLKGSSTTTYVVGNFETEHERPWPSRVWHNTITDIRNAPWNWMFRRVLSHLIPLCFVVFLIIVIVTGPFLATSSTSPVCLDDGTFSFGSNRPYNRWDAANPFSITMIATDNLSFGNAKLIDVVWDIAAGRGGQAVMAVFAYHVFTRTLVRSMESSTVSQETFKAIVCKDTTVSSAWKLVVYFFTNNGVRARFTMFWIILAAIFVLVTPTWLSAMTGYTSALTPFVINKEQNLIALEQFQPVVYTVHDGARVGLSHNTPVTVPWAIDPSSGGTSLAGLSAGNWYSAGGFFGCNNGSNYSGSLPSDPQLPVKDNSNDPCAWMWRVSQYVSNYGFFGGNKTNSSFIHPNGTILTFTAEEGTLNVTASFYNDTSYNESLSWYINPFGYNYQRSVNGSYIFRTNVPSFYQPATLTLYNLIELNINGACQPSKNEYRWGFSFALTYFFAIGILIWSIVIWSIYFDGYLHSRLDANGRRLGLERGVLDLATTIQAQLETEDTTFYGNPKLFKLIQGKTITYNHLSFDALRPSRRVQLSRWWRAFSFKTWAMAEMWWLGALFVFSLLFGLSFDPDSRLGYYWLPYLAIIPVAGVLFVLMIGRGARSRWVVFAFLFLCFIISDILMSIMLTS